MNNRIWKEFDEFVKSMFLFTNGKSIVLWGYNADGFFIQHLFTRVNRKIEYIVDDGSMNPKIPVMRSVEINNISPAIHSVIIAGMRDDKKEEFLVRRGFREGVHFIYARKCIYEHIKGCNLWKNLSYYDYLENKYGVDIVGKKLVEEMEYPQKDALNYSPGLGYPLMDVLDNFIFTEEDAVFDFGCGKGGALILFQKSGVKKWGGVEYDKQLYNVLLQNFEKMGIGTEQIINGDAAAVGSELDGYNYFFMYNPFQGETFCRTVENMEKSWSRKRRRLTFIYSGPYCHTDVVEHGIFRLSKQIYTDYSVRNVNIYTTDE